METATIYANNEYAQRAWAREHRRRSVRALAERGSIWTRVRSAPHRTWRPNLLDRILVAQVREFAPDVLVCLSVVMVDPRVLSELRNTIGLIVGQHAATPLPNLVRLRCYDLLLSSFPATVENLRRAGLTAEPFRLGFDTDVLARISNEPAAHEVSFVGSLFGGVHDSRVAFLERLCDRFDGMRVWTASVEGLAASSSIRRHYVADAWGIDMYRVLRQSRIVINHHGDFSQYANNSRLYEATGSGTLLVTDAKVNLGELFAVGEEVLSYDDADHCIELVERHLANEDARAAVALAGHNRTLREHTYSQRMQELLELLERVASGRRRA